MTIQNELTLSFYKEVDVLNKEKQIFLVKHVETGQFFIKKILNTYNAEIFKQLKLHRPKGIPQIHECIEDDNLLYVIEDYIQGKTLEELFKERGIFTKEEVYGLMLQLCPILSQIHSFDPIIIHRDIKPSNIIISPEGALWLIDFNAAKNFTDGINSDTQLLGTRYFAAPEQYGFGQSDERTDIYGLGATMNYLLTGKYPNEFISEGKLHSILDKCLRLEPTDRYKSSSELLLELTGQDSYTENKASERESANFLTKSHWKLPLLPPGFRNGRIGAMLISSLYYIGTILFSLPDEESYLDPELTEFEINTVSIEFFIMLLVPVFFICNYMNIRECIPGTRKSDPLPVQIIVSTLIVFLFEIIFFLATP